MEPLIGEIALFAGNFAPRGWALCRGQLLSISDNTSLFSILGINFGGDGRTTFRLPDLRGRVLVGAGRGPGLRHWPVGQMAGQEQVTLTRAELPSHRHTLLAGATSDGVEPVGATFGPQAGWNTTANSFLASDAVGYTGGGQPVSIVQPGLAMNYIIALWGAYPPRS